MKIILSFALLLTASIVFRTSAQAQPSKQQIKFSGKLSGTIFVKNLSGNVGSQLTCEDLVVNAVGPRPGFESAPKDRVGAALGSGDIKTGKCGYFMLVTPNRTVTLEMPQPDVFQKCDNAIYLTSRTSTFTMAPESKRVINLTVRQASCTQVK